MEETIGQFAKRVGTTVRTLRYYDQIHLLKPVSVNEKGQKVYSQKEWELYQQIQVCKHLGMSLDEVKDVVSDPDLSPRSMLQLQKRLLEKKKSEIEEVLDTIERTERLFQKEAVDDKELDDLFFILLDSFRKEQLQVKALKTHFSEEVMGKILGQYDEPTVRDAMDQEVLLFYKRMKQSMDAQLSPTTSEVQDAVKSFYALLPGDLMVEALIEDESFFNQHELLFSSYFPKELQDYIHKSLAVYFNEKEGDEFGI